MNKKNYLTLGIIGGALIISFFLFRNQLRNMFLPEKKKFDDFPLKKGGMGKNIKKLNVFLANKIIESIEKLKQKPEYKEDNDKIKNLKILKNEADLLNSIDYFNEITEKYSQIFLNTTQIDKNLFNEKIKNFV